MIDMHEIDLPQGLSNGWSDEEISKMADIAYNLPHMWHHALGEDWKNKITHKDIEELYRRL